MKLIKQPNDYSALLCAYGMVLGQTYSQMVEIVGHDGSEILFPEQPHPFDKQLFTVEQLNQLCLDMGVYPIQVKRYIYRKEGKKLILVKGNVWDDYAFFDFIKEKQGVLIMDSQKIPGLLHAVAWDGEFIFDSSANIKRTLDSSDFILEFIYLF